MIGKKSWLYRTTVSFVIPLGLTVSPSLAIMAQATPVAQGIEGSWKISQAFQPPAGGAPPSSAGGGTRGFCKEENPIVPLMPTNKLGLTFAEHPTFFFYVPQVKTKEVKFSLLDQDKGEVIYERSFTTPDKPGIVSISLPANEAPALEADKMYYWYAEIVCNPDDSSGNAGVDGWVKRIEPNQTLATELGKANESDSLGDSLASRASLYAKNGIWYETVTTAIMRIRTNPNDPKATADWEALLTSVGLSEIAKQPLVDCCTISN